MGQVYSGPCKRCGAVDYGLSTSGPDYCGACAMGAPVKEIHLRKELSELSERHVDTLIALQIALGTKFWMTDKMRERGQAVIDKHLAEARAKGFEP